MSAMFLSSLIFSTRVLRHGEYLQTRLFIYIYLHKKRNQNIYVGCQWFFGVFFLTIRRAQAPDVKKIFLTPGV